MTAQFEVHEVSKHFGTTKALNQISFTISRGETVALIGPSGAGKSTLLNLLAGSIVPDSGSYKLCGKGIELYKGPKELAQTIGIIRQQFDLIGELAVIHNVLVGMFGKWHTAKSLLSLIIPQDKHKAVEALTKLGMADKLYQKTATLSGGQQQRVAMARLMVQNPEAILADEPIASLDPVLAEDLIQGLVRMKNENQGTLIASLHSVDIAKRYFKRIIGLRAGEVYFDLPVENVTDELLKTLYEANHIIAASEQNPVVCHEAE